MRQSHLDGIVNDLREDQDVTARLEKVFSLSSKDLPRARRLEFTKTVLGQVTERHSKHAHNAFLEAIRVLRDLTPFLKRKEQSLVYTIATIEKQSVNHASHLFFEGEVQDEELLSSVSELLEQALMRIFDARVSAPRRVRKGRSQATDKNQGVAKENHDPQVPEVNRCPLSSLNHIPGTCLFRGAAKHDKEALLPRRDSTTVATVVAGALVLKLALGAAMCSISELLESAKEIVVPWICYLQSVVKDSEHQYQRNCAAYLKRVQTALLNACRRATSDPVAVLKARAYALTLTEMKLSQYSRDLLRSVHGLTRGQVSGDMTNVFDIVGPIYEEALQHASNTYSMSDHRWFAEDVSAWLDHIALVWSMRSVSKPLPDVFANRVAALKNCRDEVGILENCELQRHILMHKLYTPNHLVLRSDKVCAFREDAFEILQEHVHKIHLPSLLALLERYDGQNAVTDSARHCELHCLKRLRLLRVLEPIRKLLVASGPHVSSFPDGAVLVLETYVKSLLDGLLTLESLTPDRSATEERSITEVRSRLEKMAGACFEAFRELSRHFFNLNDVASLGQIVTCIDILLRKHARRSKDSAQKWKSWIASFYQNRLRHVLVTYQKASLEDNSSNLLDVACLAERCERLWFSNEREDLCLDVGQAGLLDVARGCYGALEDWCKAARISLRILSIAARTASIRRPENEVNVLRKAGRCFAEDIALAFDSDDPVNLSLDCDCNPDFVLSVILEQCTAIKQSFLASNVHRRTFDALYNLQRARKLIINLLHETAAVTCPQRKLHYIWVTFTSRTSSECSSIDFDILSSIASQDNQETCHGHSRANFLSAHDYEVECSSGNASVAASLSNIILAMSARNVAIIEEELREARSIIASMNCLSRDLELMHLCAEILQWVSAVLAMEDYDQVSLLAYNLSQHCRSNLGISTAGVFILDSYRNLTGLKLRDASCGPFDAAGDMVDEQLKTCREANKAAKARQKSVSQSQQQASVRQEPVQEEDAVAALERAQRRLKLALIPFMHFTHREKSSVPQELYDFGGVSLDISFDIRSDYGQARLCHLLLLVQSLYELGNILRTIEKLADGNHYLEQCRRIVVGCMPSESYFLQLISALSLVSKATTLDSDQQCRKQLLEVLSHLYEDQCSMRDRLSKAITMQAICVLVLEKFSDRFTSRLQKAVGDELLTVLDRCETLMNTKSHDEEYSTIASFDGRVGKRLIDSFVQCDAAGIEHMVAMVENDSETPLSTKLACAYVFIHCLLHEGSELESTLKRPVLKESKTRQTNRRVTRSRARKDISNSASRPVATGQGLREILAKSEPKILAGYFCPQFCRRIWNLRGILEEEVDVSLASLVLSIGCTFDLRWASSMRAQANRISKTLSRQNDVDGLSNTFNQMSIDATADICLDVDIPQLQGRLLHAGCVVVGLSIDESMKYLVLWRISSGATTSKRILLPDDTETSVAGVRRRLDDVIADMKARSVKTGQVLNEQEREEWWEHRHNLDTEVKNIVSDIDRDWFGHLRMLLIPSLFEPDVLGFELQRQGNDYFEALMRMLHGSFPELSGSSPGDASEPLYRDTSRGNNTGIGELVLVVDSVLEAIPWEALPVLRRLNVSVTRAPSLRFLTYHLKQLSHQIDPQSLFYVVNPGGDLNRTEKTFKELEGYSTWSGSFGKVSKEEVSAAYNHEQVFLYCGHGAGDQYVSAQKVSKHGRAPIALLMGCSSARPLNLGMRNCESNGSAVDYLLRGSHAVVGNLWDVGDKDIDRFTVSLLSHWLGIGTGIEEENSELMSLAESVAAARSACHLPYLAGAASVVMGAPQIWASIGEDASWNDN